MCGCDDGQGTAAADEQSGEVVAGHVLHDFAAHVRNAAITRNHLQPEHVIARGAVAVALRPRRRSCDDRADRRVVIGRRVKGKALPLCACYALERAQRDSRLNRGHEICGLVFAHFVQLVHAQNKRRARRRSPAG
jgi:hypothetical protein